MMTHGSGRSSMYQAYSAERGKMTTLSKNDLYINYEISGNIGYGSEYCLKFTNLVFVLFSYKDNFSFIQIHADNSSIKYIYAIFN